MMHDPAPMRVEREVRMLAKFDGDPEPGDRPVEVKVREFLADGTENDLAHWVAADGGDPPRIEEFV